MFLWIYLYLSFLFPLFSNLYYNRFMKLTTKKNLLNLYFYFQCFAVVLNFVFFIFSILISFAWYILGQGSYNPKNVLIKFYVETSIFILIFFAYFMLTLVSAISTKNILQNKPLTKLQKFSVVIFPIITVLLYLYLIFKLFIQYR